MGACRSGRARCWPGRFGLTGLLGGLDAHVLHALQERRDERRLDRLGPCGGRLGRLVLSAVLVASRRGARRGGAGTATAH
jgi:hypothetical protein